MFPVRINPRITDKIVKAEDITDILYLPNKERWIYSSENKVLYHVTFTGFVALHNIKQIRMYTIKKYQKTYLQRILFDLI